MKKSLFVSIIIFIITVVTLVTFNTFFRKNSPEKLLIDAFESSGADIVSSEIYFKGILDLKRVNTGEKLEKIAIELAEGLGCPGDSLDYKRIDNEEMQGAEVNGTTESGLNVVISAVIRKSDARKDLSYITASVIDRNNILDIDVLNKKVKDLLSVYGVTPAVNSCFTGSFDGRLDNDRLNDICVEIFSTAAAKKVEGIYENNLISVSAYSPSIGEPVEVNGQKINLNIAIRYNSYEDKTYIWLATPVIITEY